MRTIVVRPTVTGEIVDDSDCFCCEPVPEDLRTFRLVPIDPVATAAATFEKAGEIGNMSIVIGGDGGRYRLDPLLRPGNVSTE